MLTVVIAGPLLESGCHRVRQPRVTGQVVAVAAALLILAAKHVRRKANELAGWKWGLIPIGLCTTVMMKVNAYNHGDVHDNTNPVSQSK